MAERVTAMRYAQAVFEIAKKNNEFERWQADLEVVSDIAADAKVLAFFENPKIDHKDKKKILEKQLTSLNKPAQNLTYLLVDEGRLAMAGDIFIEYSSLYDKKRGTEKAVVRTAVSLSEKEKEEISVKLSKMFNKNIELEAVTDMSIISGMIVRVGGKLLDGSTRSRLEKLRKEIGEVRI